MAETGPALVMTVLVIWTNGLWFYIKHVLRREGRRASWFHDHFRDISGLRELVAETDDGPRRRRFRRLLWGWYASVVSIGLGFALLVLLSVLRTRGTLP